MALTQRPPADGRVGDSEQGLTARFAADAERYSQWADELAATGDTAGAELARRRSDHLAAIVRDRGRAELVRR